MGASQLFRSRHVLPEIRRVVTGGDGRADFRNYLMRWASNRDVDEQEAVASGYSIRKAITHHDRVRSKQYARAQQLL